MSPRPEPQWRVGGLGVSRASRPTWDHDVHRVPRAPKHEGAAGAGGWTLPRCAEPGATPPSRAHTHALPTGARGPPGTPTAGPGHTGPHWGGRPDPPSANCRRQNSDQEPHGLQRTRGTPRLSCLEAGFDAADVRRGARPWSHSWSPHTPGPRMLAQRSGWDAPGEPPGSEGPGRAEATSPPCSLAKPARLQPGGDMRSPGPDHQRAPCSPPTETAQNAVSFRTVGHLSVPRPRSALRCLQAEGPGHLLVFCSLGTSETCRTTRPGHSHRAQLFEGPAVPVPT